MLLSCLSTSTFSCRFSDSLYQHTSWLFCTSAITALFLSIICTNQYIYVTCKLPILTLPSLPTLFYLAMVQEPKQLMCLCFWSSLLERQPPQRALFLGQNKATALHVAAAEGNVDLCMMLLQADASIDAQDTVRAVRNACVPMRLNAGWVQPTAPCYMQAT